MRRRFGLPYEYEPAGQETACGLLLSRHVVPAEQESKIRRLLQTNPRSSPHGVPSVGQPGTGWPESGTPARRLPHI